MPSGKTKHVAGPTAGPSQRQLRVAEEIRHTLSVVFSRADFRDPELADLQVTVTEVRASPDLRHMTAFVSGLGKALPEGQLKALRRVAPWLRTQVAKSVKLRTAPEIHFQPDTALDYAMHIDRVMRQPEVARDLGPKAPTEAPAEAPSKE